MSKPTTLKALVWPLLCFAPFFIAEEEGYFAEQGLKIERVKMMYTIDSAWPALDQGQLNVAAGYVTIGLFNALAGGAKIKMVADKVQITSTGCVSRALIARRALVKAGELDNPAQLQGRRIAVNPVALEGYCLDLLLKTAGQVSVRPVRHSLDHRSVPAVDGDPAGSSVLYARLSGHCPDDGERAGTDP